MQAEKFRLKIYLVVFAILLVLGITGFMLIENISLADAIYFTIVTMATVGYGDIAPQTGVGKILALVIIIGGVGTFLGVVASITDVFVNRREELVRQQKLNLVTGLFFSEIGNQLLNRIAKLDPNSNGLLDKLKISGKWQNKDFEEAGKILADHQFSIKTAGNDIAEMKDFLLNKAGLLLRIIENPIIHEHEHFTETLQAVLHLREELLNRKELIALIETDRNHLEGDILRVYSLLSVDWIRYMRYLKENYAYLFSLAMRLNPFDPTANAVVE